MINGRSHLLKRWSEAEDTLGRSPAVDLPPFSLALSFSLFVPCNLPSPSQSLFLSLTPSRSLFLLFLVSQLLSGGAGGVVSVLFFRGGEGAHHFVYFVLQFSLCFMFYFFH